MTFPISARLLLPFVMITTTSLAETVKDREGAVRADRAAMENDARWLYNEVDQGFAEARRTGKPLLVVLRCVPCLSCAGIDAGVLKAGELAPLLDRFVCIRVINANALDLARFQFDYDLSFSTLFFNGDGTIYGRFGSWRHQKNAQESDLASFRRALEAALAIHADYPANRAALAGKQGAPTPFRTPIEIPPLAGKYQRTLDWSGKVVASCVHCHQIGDAFRTFHRERGEPVPAEWVYPHPAPETVGLRLAADDVATVQAVTPGSPAAAANLRAGDRIRTLAGQPLVSVADVSWVLHRAGDSASLAVTVEREGGAASLELVLPQGWRDAADISRRVGTWGMRAMALGGLVLVDLTDAERRQRGLGMEGMALLVTHAGEYGTHAAAKKAGFRKDDIVVAMDGQTGRVSESALIGRTLRERRPGQTVKATVLRDGTRVELGLPMQ